MRTPKASEERAWLRDLQRETGLPVPPELLAEPEPLPDWIAYYAEAYEVCGRSRSLNGGYLTVEAISAYCDLLAIECLDERRSLLRVLLAADARVHAEQREQKSGEGAARG